MQTRLTSRLILALIIALALTLVLSTFEQVRFFARADEGCYLRYAAYLGEKGPSGLAAIFQGFIQDQPHWFNPNPLRIGFIILSGAWLKILGYSFMNLAFLSLFSYALFLGLSYYFSRKYLGEQLALLLVILLAFSPLQMAMARRALIESTTNLFLVSAVWLFWDFLKSRSRLKSILFIAVFTGSILIKETSVLLIFVFLPYFLADRFIYGKKTSLKEIAFILFLPLILAGLAYLLLGCFPYILETLKILCGPPQPASYATLFCSGPWYRYLIDYMLLSPWVVILAVGFIFSFFLQREEEGLSLYFIFVFLLTFILFNIFMKNVRYVIILDTPLRLFSLLMLNRIVGRIYPRQAMKLTFALVMALALFDYFNFYQLFIQEGIYDPASFFLLKAKHFIPFN